MKTNDRRKWIVRWRNGWRRAWMRLYSSSEEIEWKQVVPENELRTCFRQDMGSCNPSFLPLGFFAVTLTPTLPVRAPQIKPCKNLGISHYQLQLYQTSPTVSTSSPTSCVACSPVTLASFDLCVLSNRLKNLGNHPCWIMISNESSAVQIRSASWSDTWAYVREHIRHSSWMLVLYSNDFGLGIPDIVQWPGASVLVRCQARTWTLKWLQNEGKDLLLSTYVPL